MKVLFDHQIAVNQQVGGISRYFYNLINALINLPEFEYELSCLVHKNIYFSANTALKAIPDFHFSLINKMVHSHKATMIINTISEMNTSKIINKNEYDVLHVTDHNIQYLNKCKITKPIVLTVHDLIPELFPNNFPDIKNRLKQRAFSIQKADFFICISESTQNDLIKIYGIEKKKTAIIHHGDPSYFNNYFSDFQFKNEFSENKKYILYVGDRTAIHKNFIKTIENTSGFLHQNKDVFFLCVGANFTKSEMDHFNFLGISKKIFSIKATESQLYGLYKNAICLMYPSIYEGFGLPLLEAMKTSCPILCSNSSCLPEIAKNGAVYFDPITFTGFQSNLESLIEARNALELTTIQKQVLKQYSWEKTAKLTLETYKKAISI